MANKISMKVVNFEKEMRRVEKEVQRLANKDIKNRVDFAVNTLRVVTPIDKGEARAGWEDKTYRAADGFLDGTISNDVEHIEYLNRGHSKQAPQYFIEQVLIKIGLLKP